MTRGEAIKELREMKTDPWTDNVQMEALDMAVNSLTVDEMYDLEFEGVDHFVPVSIIEDIKADISSYKDDKAIHAERNEMIDIVLEIIDKHKERV